jgi:hypothetical protein
MMTALLKNVMDKGKSKHVLSAWKNEKNAIFLGDWGEM